MARGGGVGFRVQGSGFRVQGSGSRAQGAGFRVQGLGLRPGSARGFETSPEGKAGPPSSRLELGFSIRYEFELVSKLG